MDAAQRREEIYRAIKESNAPIKGSELARQFAVSRQIIVQDIAILKGTGYEILSTHNGYVLQTSPLKERVFKVWHTTESTEEELNCIVNLGGMVADVFVWHKVYGKITAPLNIFSEFQVKQFIEGVRSGKSTELMHVTGGYHYHTVQADSEEILDRIGAALEKKGYLVPEI